MLIQDGSDNHIRCFEFGIVPVTGGHGRSEQADLFSELFLGGPPRTKPTLLLEIGSDAHGRMRWSFSPGKARALAAMLREAADFQEQYREEDYPAKPWPFGPKGEE